MQTDQKVSELMKHIIYLLLYFNLTNIFHKIATNTKMQLFNTRFTGAQFLPMLHLTKIMSNTALSTYSAGDNLETLEYIPTVCIKFMFKVILTFNTCCSCE
jgi:hypothetical protein